MVGDILEVHVRERLQFVIHEHRAEMERHQRSIGTTFYWTLTIMLTLGAGLMTLAASERWSPGAERWPLPLIVSIVTLLLAALAVAEMMKRVAAYDANAVVIARASRLLGLFDKGVFGTDEQLYPDKWRNWGEAGKHPAIKILPAFHGSVLSVVALAVSALAWLTLCTV